MTIATEQLAKPQQNAKKGYRFLLTYLHLRERFRKPTELLKTIGLEKEDSVLDYGCGAGSYSIPASDIVGDKGKVYALDIHPKSIEYVKKRAMKQGITNLETILSGLETGLPNGSIDFALVLDVFYWVKNRQALLKEVSRILKPSGRLILLVDHMTPEDCKAIVQDSDLFKLCSQDENLLQYMKMQ